MYMLHYLSVVVLTVHLAVFCEVSSSSLTIVNPLLSDCKLMRSQDSIFILPHQMGYTVYL